MICNVALSRVEIIEQKMRVCVRKWLGLPKVTNSSALYRSKGSLQLPLTSIVEIYKTGKVWTVMMLKESKDNTIASYQPEVRTGRKWNAEEKTEICIMSLEHRDIVGATCIGQTYNVEKQLHNASQSRENST